MFFDENEIGKNILKARTEKKMSQTQLANLCGIQSSVLSCYENSRKIPNLITIANIASQLNVSIDYLCYGDESMEKTISISTKGKRIANHIYSLWKMDVIDVAKKYIGAFSYTPYDFPDEMNDMFIYLKDFNGPISRLLFLLEQFREKEDTYQEKEKYLEILLSSIANEIDR